MRGSVAPPALSGRVDLSAVQVLSDATVPSLHRGYGVSLHERRIVCELRR